MSRSRNASGRPTICRDEAGRGWHGDVSSATIAAGPPELRQVRGTTRKGGAVEARPQRHRPRSRQRLTLDESLVVIRRARKPKIFEPYSTLV